MPVPRECVLPFSTTIQSSDRCFYPKHAKVRSQLLQRGVMLEEFGGDVQCVEVSATAGHQLGALTDAVLLLADMLDLTADPELPAETVVLGAC